MSSKETRVILTQLANKELTVAKALALLNSVGTRKLRGVTASTLEKRAYETFVKEGDFRAFSRELGLDTAAAQNSLGKITRAIYEKQPE